MRLMSALLLVLFAAATALAQTGASSRDAPGPYDIAIEQDIWTDVARDRDVPVTIYRPAGDGPFPVIVFSHGLGGSRDAAPYLGRHWASWGFVGVFVQHPGTDQSVWQGLPRTEVMTALRRAARSPRAARNRFEDIPFVLDRIEALAASGDLPANPARMGIAGHSYGAHSVMAALGRYHGMAGRLNFDEPRLLAGAALSPPPAHRRSRGGAVYAGIAEPVLHLTGTEDSSPLDGDATPEDRLEAFESMGPAPQYLLVFDGGDHSVFGGRTRPGQDTPENYPAIQADVTAATTLFFEAWLNDNAEARAALDGPDFIARFSTRAEVRRRNLP